MTMCLMCCPKHPWRLGAPIFSRKGAPYFFRDHDDAAAAAAADDDDDANDANDDDKVK